MCAGKELTELLLTNGANVNHKDGAGLTTTDYALMALSGEKDPNKAEQLSDIINYLKAIFSFWFYGCGNQVWMFWRSAFRRFWFSAPASDVLWFFAHAGQSKSVSLEITDLGKLADRADGQG